jgi:hypothetical protein
VLGKAEFGSQGVELGPPWSSLRDWRGGGEKWWLADWLSGGYITQLFDVHEKLSGA